MILDELGERFNAKDEQQHAEGASLSYTGSDGYGVSLLTVDDQTGEDRI